MLDPENEYVILYARTFSGEKNQSSNFKNISVNFPPLCWRTALSLHKILEKQGIDLFHSPFYLAPWKLECPSVITVHDLMMLAFPNFFTGRNMFVRSYASWFMKVAVPRSLSKATRLIADSHNTRGDLMNFLGLPAEKIVVIHPGISSHFRKIEDEENLRQTRKELGLHQRIVLYFGNTRPYKNLPRLLRAFGGLLQESGGKDYVLVIAGAEKRNATLLKKMANDLRINENVVLIGGLSEEKAVSLMNLAEVFVFPSLYEGFGFPPLEAMACGTPVITSNRASLPEVVGDAALLVNPESEKEIASAMHQLLTDKGLREQLVGKGYRRIKKFSWEETARRTLKVYTEIYQERKR